MLVDRGLCTANGGGWHFARASCRCPSRCRASSRHGSTRSSRTEDRAPRRGRDRPRLLARGRRGVCDLERAAVDDILHVLERKEFVRRVAHERRRGRASVFVPSRVVRDVAYGSDPASRATHRSTGSPRRGSSRSDVPRITRRRSRTTIWSRSSSRAARGRTARSSPRARGVALPTRPATGARAQCTRRRSAYYDGALELTSTERTADATALLSRLGRRSTGPADRRWPSSGRARDLLLVATARARRRPSPGAILC